MSGGHKTAAVIDLKKHKALWEDIEDVLVSRSRSREKGIPLAKVKASLIARGKLITGLCTRLMTRSGA